MTAETAFRLAWSDLLGHFWTGDAIAPMQDRSFARGLWCQAQFANLIYWQWKRSGDPALAQMLQSNFDAIVAALGEDAMSDGSGAVVGASDDAAWIGQAYIQVYDACGDQRALDAAKRLLVSTRALYAGPNDNAHGLYYTLPNPDSNHRSSLYEVGIGLAAMAIWEKSGGADSEWPWCETAINAYAWMQRDLVTPDGTHFCEFSLDTLAPIGSVDDRNALYLGGTMGMAVLAAKLFAATGQDSYRLDALAMVEGILKRLIVVSRGRRILSNNRDAWTEGFYLPAFVENVLPLDGINPLIKTVIANTGASVARFCRTADGFYGGDWAGGGGWGNEPADQIMTSANSVQTILARAMILS